MVRVEDNDVIAEYYEKGEDIKVLHNYLVRKYTPFENEKFIFIDSMGKMFKLVKYKAKGSYEVNIPEIYGISLRKDYEQQFLIDDLFDDEVQLVCVEGDAGTGKTFIALLGALYMSKHIVYTRENVDVGRSMGFLKGTEEEKFAPYLRGLWNNIKELEFLTGKRFDKSVEAQTIYSMRGGTFRDTVVILDEAQNSSIDVLKMVMSRMGEGSKIVLCGSFKQIDDITLRNPKNPFKRVLERFKGYKLFGYNKLTVNKRTELCRLVEELLSDEYEIVVDIDSKCK